MKLKVYRGTEMTFETPLLNMPTAVSTFYMDNTEPRTPAVAVASGSFIYIYKNLRPYFKFTLPALQVGRAVTCGRPAACRGPSHVKCCLVCHDVYSANVQFMPSSIQPKLIFGRKPRRYVSLPCLQVSTGCMHGVCDLVCAGEDRRCYSAQPAGKHEQRRPRPSPHCQITQVQEIHNVLFFIMMHIIM